MLLYGLPLEASLCWACCADAVAGISCAVLLALFAVQRFGTARLGSAFSPILIVWFLFNGAVGVYDIAAYETHLPLMSLLCGSLSCLTWAAGKL